MFRFFQALYPALYTAALILISPVFAYRVLFEEKRGMKLLQRAGRLPARLLRAASPRTPRLWIHAVSVGEVNAVRSLVSRLADHHQLFFSTTTETGQSLASRIFADSAVVFFLPFDWKWACKRYLKAISPEALLLTESEFWPGMIQTATEMNIPLILVNGRISDRSWKRYRHLRFFFSPLLNRLTKCCMQSRQDRTRILELGVQPERVHLVGNLKYDYSLAEDREKAASMDALLSLLKPTGQEPIWVCGSTRQGEEELLIPVFESLKEQFPQLKWVIAPRHPHRADSIERLLSARHIDCRKSSQLELERSPETSLQLPSAELCAIILDSIGELAYLYALADVVFIGGSLVPVGGHNLIEAAYFGKPILFGPHMENFREIAETFVEGYGALQVKDSAELLDRIRELLRDEKARQWLGRNARKVIRENQGSVERTAEIIAECISKHPDRSILPSVAAT
jgi:3-deoxy-D-manno-octulosonic-acid transferase